MLYVGRLHNGDETRVQTHDCCAALAGRVQRIARPKARLVFEEVSLVYGLVECSIALLPHLLLAASRRDEVEATTRLPAARLLEPREGHREGHDPAGVQAFGARQRALLALSRQLHHASLDVLRTYSKGGRWSSSSTSGGARGSAQPAPGPALPQQAVECCLASALLRLGVPEKQR